MNYKSRCSDPNLCRRFFFFLLQYLASQRGWLMVQCRDFYPNPSKLSCILSSKLSSLSGPRWISLIPDTVVDEKHLGNMLLCMSCSLGGYMYKKHSEAYRPFTCIRNKCSRNESKWIMNHLHLQRHQQTNYSTFSCKKI